MTNSTSGNPEVRETKLAAMKLGELRAHARKLRIDGADELHKPELLAKVKDHHYVSELSSMKLAELRAHARKLGIDGADELHKPELLAKVKDAHYAQAHGGKHHDGSGGKHHAGSGAESTGGSEMRSSAEQDRGRNPTPEPPDVSETKLAPMKMDELRPHMPEPGIDGVDEPHKPELPTEVTDAPNTPLGGHLSSREEERHDGHDGHDGGATTAQPTETTATYDYHTGRDTSGPPTDDAITRSEERLNVGAETREADRAELRNPVVTEHQRVSVPMWREELTVGREPIVEANRDAATDGLTISEEQQGVVPREERPVVGQEAVPGGYVPLGAQTGIEQGISGTQIRKEEES
jgi:stress response protein YsnF